MDKAKFFATAKRIVAVETPHGTVHVREISARELSRFQLGLAEKKSGKADQMRERLVVLCACDADGKSIFAEADCDKLGDVPASVLEPIFIAAQELNKIGQVPDADDAKKN